MKVSLIETLSMSSPSTVVVPPTSENYFNIGLVQSEQVGVSLQIIL